jgi:sugar transferase EpsL
MRTGAPHHAPDRGAMMTAKRALDLALGSAAAVLTLPVAACAALAIRVTMGRPVIFRQVRAGYLGRPFTILKFRTMRDAGTDENPLPDGARLTRLGRLLRRTSIDELPQLWNVLRGDMSLVGPRPLFMDYLPLYSAEQARRHEVRPGITGWTQVSGRNALSWKDKFELDVWYVDNRSIRLDLRILLFTLLQVIQPHGVSQPGYDTVEYFTGNE